MSDPQLTVPFTGGLNESINARHVPAGQLTTAQNVVYPREGTLDKRYGYTALPGNVLANAKRLAVFKDELVAINGTRLYSYADGASAWEDTDAVPAPRVTRQPAFNTAASYQQFDIAYHANGLFIYAYVENAQAYALIVDADNGAIVLGPSAVGAGATTAVKLCVIGTKAILVYSTTAPDVRGSTIDIVTLGSWSATATLQDTAMVNANGMIGFAEMSDRFAVSYEVAANSIRTRTWSSALAVQASVTTAGFAAFAATTALGARGTTGETLWVGVGGPGGTCVVGLNPATLATTVAITTMNATATPQSIGIERVSATQAVVVSGFFAGVIIYRQVSTAAATVGPIQTLWTMGLASRPFIVGSSVYVVLVHGNGAGTTSAQPTYYVADLIVSEVTNVIIPRLSAIVAPRIGSQFAALITEVPHVVTTGTSKVETLIAVARTTSGRSGLDRVTIDMASTRRWMPAQVGESLHLNGFEYDGNRVFETSYAYYPIVSTHTTPAGGIGAGTRKYKICYEQVDRQGNVHRSAPGPAGGYTVTIAGALDVSLQIYNLLLSARPKQLTPGVYDPNSIVYVVLYRTTAGGTVYYRVTPEPYPVANRCLLGTQINTILDSMTDTVLISNPLLYTEGGVLDNVCPPSFVHVCAHKNRAWGIGDDERTIWFSQPYDTGVAPGFNELLTFRVDDSPNKLTGVASFLDKLIVFTAREIYAVYGDGPALSGVGSDLSPPQLVSSAIGCINPLSIVQSPMGLHFQSERGFELLDASLQVVPFESHGALVYQTTSAYPTCAGATVVPAQSHVRFAMGSRTIVWDYRRNRWSVFSMNSYSALGAGTPVTAAAFHNTHGYVMAQSDAVNKEVTTAWTDNGNWVTAIAETGWLHEGGGFQGWQRIRRIRLLGERFTAHNLTIDLARDYAAYTESHAVSELTSTASGEWFRFTPGTGIAKCSAFRMKITDSAPLSIGTGQGAALNGFALETIVKPGGYRNLAAAVKS